MFFLYGGLILGRGMRGIEKGMEANVYGQRLLFSSNERIVD
jgi:hypothetical protein